MKEGFRQSMAWLHTWAGLLVGWVLFFVFVTGTLGYVNAEIDHWMRAEEPLAARPAPTEQLIPAALARLAEIQPGAQHWQVELPGGREAGMRIWWRERPVGDERYGQYGDEQLDPMTGQPLAIEVRETGGGHTLYRMHYELHYLPYEWAIRIVGICAMFMMIAIVSGIITHKKIFKDFFSFRPGKGQRSWLDGHNVLSVTALPFHLMITYSGLVFFMFAYMPAGPSLIYGPGGEDRLYDEAYGYEEDIGKPLAPAAAQAPVMPLFAAAEREWGQDGVRSLAIENPGRADARVIAARRTASSIGRGSEEITFDGVTGQRLPDEKDRIVAAARFNSVLLGLHEGRFASAAIRLLYLVAGVAGSAMIATGLLLWSTKRKAKLAKAGTPHFGIAIVDRLNLGTIVGLPIGIAAYFWANRMIPAGMAGREAWEVHALFIAWAATFVYPIWRPLPRAWIELSGTAALAFGLLPILNVLTTHRPFWAALLAGDWVLVGFDLAAVGASCFFGWLAVKQARRTQAGQAPRTGRTHAAELAAAK